MSNFVKNANKLAPLGSSQPNESLNNTTGSKAPKIRHYGASESNDFRVACAGEYWPHLRVRGENFCEM